MKMPIYVIGIADTEPNIYKIDKLFLALASASVFVCSLSSGFISETHSTEPKNID